MDRLLLVDGSNLLFQMFFGMPARIINSKGKAIQGTLGFVGALLKMIRMVRPSHIAVLFDGEHENPRAALDESYKANRAEDERLAEESPFSQLEDVYRALSYLGLRHAETVNCETDDWMAGYARCLGDHTEIVIASMDSDFFQLITPNVRVLRYRGKNSVLCDEDYIREKLGVDPARYADFKALTGDASDNIRGVPGVGPKTAARLLERFGSLEEIIENVDEVEKPSVRRALAENRDRLRLNDKLIRLEGVRELPFSWDALQWADTGETTVQVLRAIGLYD